VTFPLASGFWAENFIATSRPGPVDGRKRVASSVRLSARDRGDCPAFDGNCGIFTCAWLCRR
jgi:hypothetical protein